MLAVRSVSFWVGAGLIVFGAIFIGVQRAVIVQEQQYASEGRVVDGLVISKAIKHATRSGSRESRTEYAVTYRFMAGGGRYEGEQNVSSDDWDRLREMEPVKIQYVASDPSTNRIAGETSTALQYVFGGVGLTAGCIGLLLLVRSVRSAKTKAHIWAHGVAVDATVSSVEETNIKINRRPMWIVRYQYRDHTGQSREGKSEYMSADQANRWKPGDSISIRYHRDKPDASVWSS
jgi:hypothetical protein